jgi:putative ATP-dependent endonuclease of OLD family
LQIQKIYIENYRSIRELDFQPGKLTALIGPNNSGKTNILSALDFLLGGRFPTANSLMDSDFFGKSRRGGLKIGVQFKPNFRNVDWLFYRYVPDDLRNTGARYTLLGETRAQYLNNDVKDDFPLVYLDADRNYDRQFGTSQWSLWGQAIRHLNEHYKSQVPLDQQEEARRNLRTAQEILRTDKYTSFVTEMAEGFKAQLRRTSHEVKVDFRNFDPLNFYKTLQPILVEDGTDQSPAEAGSGMRNLIVLALFRAYAKCFRGDAVFAVEEPEIYLHPHAQRSLALLFREMADQGAQILYSTHSAAFVSPENFDEIAVVERCPDEDNDGILCTKMRRLSASRLMTSPEASTGTEALLRERLRHACGQEHAEAFFGRAVILVEGPTERAALPIFADHMAMNLDALGISVVSANGKNSLPLLYRLYEGLGFPIYLVFDNDAGSNGNEKDTNRKLTTIAGLLPDERPAACVTSNCAILAGDYEKSLKAEVEAIVPGLHASLEQEARSVLGSQVGKPIMARFMARKLVEKGIVPPSIGALLDKVREMVTPPVPDLQFMLG